LSVAVADFNNDGKLDLAVADCAGSLFLGCGGYYDYTENFDVVTLLLGNGDGTFQAAVPVASTHNPAAVAAADLNGDGNADLVLGNIVLLGNGDGTFQSPLTSLADQYGYYNGEAIADLNGDGKPDLLATFAEEITIFLNIASDFHYTTSTGLTSSSDPASFGQSVKFRATVAPSFGGPATGTVTFLEGTNALATVPVSNNQARFSTSSLATGTHSIDASYSGDANFLASTSTTLLETINAASTTARLTSSRNPSALGERVTFSARVEGKSGETPTGTITFTDGSTTLATVSLSEGRAAYSTSELGKGRHNIVASYSGSTSFAPSSAALIQVVSSRK
jgi:hypothetical protein